MRPVGITRRSALALLFGASAAGALSYFGWRQSTASRAARHLTHVFPQLHAFARANKADPQLRTLDDSSSLIESVFGVASDQLTHIPNQVLTAKYGMVVQRDFELGRVLEVSGWVLAETEGRLIALLATVG